jgi:hypothetical protein
MNHKKHLSTSSRQQAINIISLLLAAVAICAVSGNCEVIEYRKKIGPDSYYVVTSVTQTNGIQISPSAIKRTEEFKKNGINTTPIAPTIKTIYALYKYTGAESNHLWFGYAATIGGEIDAYRGSVRTGGAVDSYRSYKIKILDVLECRRSKKTYILYIRDGMLICECVNQDKYIEQALKRSDIIVMDISKISATQKGSLIEREDGEINVVMDGMNNIEQKWRKEANEWNMIRDNVKPAP